jgi:hypothetical protein
MPSEPGLDADQSDDDGPANVVKAEGPAEPKPFVPSGKLVKVRHLHAMAGTFTSYDVGCEREVDEVEALSMERAGFVELVGEDGVPVKRRKRGGK